MKRKKEIIEKLKEYEEIKNKSNWFSNEFTLACGAITALEWVLDEELEYVEE